MISFPGAAMTTITVTRSNQGSYVDGKWVNGSESAIAMQASVQPMNGRELQNLPEGQREKEAIKIYTLAPLNTANQQNGTVADVVSYNGIKYVVDNVSGYPGYFYKSIAYAQ